MKIRIIKDITFNKETCYESSFKIGDILESDEPYQGINEDGSFSICQGMNEYLTLPKNYFIIIKN